ncbi:putative 13.6 kDa [Guinea pig adenovirus 1]|uniref:13.6 kDa n=1 Tax=Guinea pig adenovirus 1 TaxID=2847100 RepID=A0AC61M053_9ADEN|nr:putative 13.6 kDa [Guinea pig adenovirus]QIZ64151.1 putative 13.6 kDa [Guinea pig adenovirus 1]QIZ64183.1 putative 13.6 kDa [Guinea pig adenovirus]
MHGKVRARMSVRGLPSRPGGRALSQRHQGVVAREVEYEHEGHQLFAVASVPGVRFHVVSDEQATHGRRRADGEKLNLFPPVTRVTVHAVKKVLSSSGVAGVIAQIGGPAVRAAGGRLHVLDQGEGPRVVLIDHQF